MSTITSLCPITETKTISGIVTTTTYTSTSYIVTDVPTEIETSVTLPGKIETYELSLMPFVFRKLTKIEVLLLKFILQ